MALADVHENAVRSAVEKLVSSGHKAIPVGCNVADEAEVAAMVEQTVSTLGRPHGVRSGRDRRGDSRSLRRPGCIRRTVRPMKTEESRICPSCGNEVSAALKFCLVCMLRGDGVGSRKARNDVNRRYCCRLLPIGEGFAGPTHEVGASPNYSERDGEDWELASDGLSLPMDDMVEFP